MTHTPKRPLLVFILFLTLLGACTKGPSGTGNGDSYVGGNGKYTQKQLEGFVTSAMAGIKTTLGLLAQGKFTQSLYLPPNSVCMPLWLSCAILKGKTGTDATLPGDQIEKNLTGLAQSLDRVSFSYESGKPPASDYTSDAKMVMDLQAGDHVIHVYASQMEDDDFGVYAEEALITHELLHDTTGDYDGTQVGSYTVKDLYTLSGTLLSDVDQQFGSTGNLPTPTSAGAGGFTVPPPPPGI